MFCFNLNGFKFSNNALDHTLNQWIFTVDWFHRFVCRLESDPVGLAIEFFERGVLVVKKGYDHIAISRRGIVIDNY